MRANNTDPNQQAVIKSFANLYGKVVNVDDFTNEGIVLKDENGKTVAPIYGEIREGVIHTGTPYAEIMVIGWADGTLFGWVRANSMKDAGDRYLVPVSALNRLPKSFSFTQECPHLSVYGGVYTSDMDGWTCLGCGQTVVMR